LLPGKVRPVALQERRHLSPSPSRYILGPQSCVRTMVSSFNAHLPLAAILLSHRIRAGATSLREAHTEACFGSP
jgi:hypothetical protein